MVTLQEYDIHPELQKCFLLVRESMRPIELKEFQDRDEQDLSIYHHGLGRFLRNKLRLWGPESNSTREYFQHKLAIFHPDDMSGIILKSFHRLLNGKPLELEDQAKHYHEYWKNVQP